MRLNYPACAVEPQNSKWSAVLIRFSATLNTPLLLPIAMLNFLSTIIKIFAVLFAFRSNRPLIRYRCCRESRSFAAIANNDPDLVDLSQSQNCWLLETVLRSFLFKCRLWVRPISRSSLEMGLGLFSWTDKAQGYVILFRKWYIFSLQSFKF